MRVTFLGRTAFALLAVVFAVSSGAECVSVAQQLSRAGASPVRVARGIGWSGSVVAVASHQAATEELYVSIHDEYLNRLTGDVLVSKDVRIGQASVVWNGSDFGIFFQTTDSRLFLQRVSTSGQLIGSAVRVTPELRFAPSDSYDVAWSPAREAWVVSRVTMFAAGRSVSAWMVEKDGATRSRHDAVIALADETLSRVAASADGTIGVLFRGAGGVVFLARLLPSNQWAVPLAIGKGVNGFAIAAKGTEFGVARSVAISGDRTEIRWVRIGATGAVVTSERLLVSPITIDANVSALTAADGTWALAYNDSFAGIDDDPGALRLHRFDDAGQRISSSVFAPEFVQEGAFGRANLIWTGSAFVTLSERSTKSDSFLLRLCPVLPEIQTSARYVRRDEIVTFNAAATGGRPGYTWIWNFGEGSATETRATEKYRWRKTGTYTVTLKATDATGATGETTITIRVVDPKRRAVGQ